MSAGCHRAPCVGVTLHYYSDPVNEPSPRHEATPVGALAPCWLLEGLGLGAPRTSPGSWPGAHPAPDPSSPSHTPQYPRWSGGTNICKPVGLEHVLP